MFIYLYRYLCFNISRLTIAWQQLPPYPQKNPWNFLLSLVSLHPPCAHRAFTVCSLALSAPFALIVHKAFTLLSPCVHKAFTMRPLCVPTVRSALTYRLVPLHSFSFRTFKWKKRSLRVTTKWEKNMCVKVEGNLHFTSETSFL